MLVANPLRRYPVGDHTPGLVKNAEASTDILNWASRIEKTHSNQALTGLAVVAKTQTGFLWLPSHSGWLAEALHPQK